MISFTKKNKFYLAAAGFTYLLMFVYFQFLLPRVKVANSVMSMTYFNITSAGGSDVWISGKHGIILHSSDKGRNWKYQENPFFLKEDITSIKFLDVNRGWALSKSGVIETRDGGKNWKKIFTTEDYKLKKIFPFSENEIVVLGSKKKYSQAIALITEDRFKTLKILKEETEDYNNYVNFFKFDESRYWLVYLKHIYVTWNRGKNWKKYLLIPEADQGYFETICFKDNESAIAVYNDEVFITENGGRKWSGKQNFNWYYHCRKAAFSPNYRFLIGSNYNDEFHPLFLRSEDKGSTWKEVNGFRGIDDLRDIIFLDDNRGIICGSNGSIIETNDGGKSWKLQRFEWIPYPAKKRLYDKRAK